MARDYLNIGPTPASEECQQLGPNYNNRKARAEMAAFINQIRRELGPEPEGARLAVKSFPHDYGTYSEVVCWFDDTLPDSVDYAFKCEGDIRDTWDDKAIIELAKHGADNGRLDDIA